jgi:hypothetical protein
MGKKTELTKEEEDKVILASSRVWQEIHGDAQALGASDKESAIEFIIDRLYTKLEDAVMDKFRELQYDNMCKLLMDNSNRWY